MKISTAYIIFDCNDEMLDVIFKSQEEALMFICNNLPKNMRDSFKVERLSNYILFNLCPKF